MTHALVCNYGLYKKMEVFRPALVEASEMTKFHSDDYINFIKLITPDNMGDHIRDLQRCKPNIYTLCTMYTFLYITKI
jgi:histone deacetylase 1/2